MSRTTTIPMEDIWHSDAGLKIPPPTYASSFQDIDLEAGSPRPSYDSDKEYLLRSSRLQYLTPDRFTISDYEDETFSQSSAYEEYDPFAFLADFDFISDGLWQSSPSPSRAASLTERLVHYPTRRESKARSSLRYPSSSSSSSSSSSRPRSKIYPLSKADASSSSSPPPPPSLILLFGWTNARYQHLTIYASTYKQLFPTSRILIVTTTLPDLLIHSTPTKAARLVPVIDAVAHHLATRPHPPGTEGAEIVVHAFSDGGSHKAVEFAEAYGRRIGARLPVRAVCLDSTPGVPRYLAYCSAFRKCLLGSNPITQYLGALLGYLLVGLLFALYHVVLGVSANVIDRTRDRLDDTAVWPLAVPRLYLYSKTDALIGWRDVRAHREGAAGMGRRVSEVVFERSMHCAHVVEDGERYWGAVVEVWAEAMGARTDGREGEGELRSNASRVDVAEVGVAV